MGKFFRHIQKFIVCAALGILGHAYAHEVLDLDIIAYEDFMRDDPGTLSILQKALYEKGIVGMRGVPGYREKVDRFVEIARAFSALPEEVKESYGPNRETGEITGYEVGKERFQRPDGTWVVDNLKVSYYGFVPDNAFNRWPVEVDLKTPYEDLGTLMAQIGEAVMYKIGLLGPATGISLEGTPKLGRMLYYRQPENVKAENPYWCGAHFDHSMLTTLLPAFYFVDGESVSEPMEAGLFVKTVADGTFKKVVANDHDVVMFQVGEFAQLVLNDAIRATEHRVQKAAGKVERYTMALFCDAPMETLIHSTSVLTKDMRYGGVTGAPCTYRQWSDATYALFLAKAAAN